MGRRPRRAITNTTQPSDAAPPEPRSMRANAPDGEAGQQAGSLVKEGAPDNVDPDLRHRMISEAAYKLYVDRGCRDGHELDDWLQAEAEVDRLLVNQRLDGSLNSDGNVLTSVLTEFHNEIMAAGYLPEEFTADVLRDGNGADGTTWYVVRVIRSAPGEGSYGIMFRDGAERKWKVDFHLALHTQQFGRPVSMPQGEGTVFTDPPVASQADNRSGLPEELGLFPPGTKQ